MSIREKPNAKRHAEAIFNQTRPELNVGDSRCLHGFSVPHGTAKGRKPESVVSERGPGRKIPVEGGLSCHGRPLWPAEVIGEFAAVPKAAALEVTSQFA